MQKVLFDGLECREALVETRNLAHSYAAPPAGFDRANSLFNPLGVQSARGFFLLLKSQLDSLHREALHTVTFDDARWASVTAHNLVIAREPVKVGYTFAEGQEDAVYLVEVADRRWACHNPTFQTPAKKYYNINARGWNTDYYTSSTNGGTAWTWTGMAEDLWNLLSDKLGTYPGLPVTPSGTPENFIFLGVSAWYALCQVLWRIGCAVSCDLSLEENQYSIVQIGATDNAMEALLDNLETAHRKLHDAEYQAIVRGKIPYGVRVFFHRREQHYGTERDTPKDSNQWLTGSVYSVDIVGPESDEAESGTYHPIWDDMQAIYDTSGALTNGAALDTRAQERSDDYFRMYRNGGGQRLHRIFDGVVSTGPGSTLKGVSWRTDHLGAIVTEIIRHPFQMLAVDGGGNWIEFEDQTALHPPDFLREEPTYPHVSQVVEIANGTPSGGVYDATIETNTTTPNTWTDRESIYAVDLAGSTSLTAGHRFIGRLVSHHSSRPLYAIDSSSRGVGGGICCGWNIISTTEMQPLYDIDLNNKNITIKNGDSSDIIVDDGGTLNLYGTGWVWQNPTLWQGVNDVCIESHTLQDYLASDQTGISTETDVTGVSIAFTTTARTNLIVMGDFDWFGGTADDEYRGYMSITPDGGSETIYSTPHARYVSEGQSGNRNRMTSMKWVVNDLASGAYTVKLKAKRHSGSGTATLNGESTSLVIHADQIIIAEKNVVYLPNGTVVGADFCVRNKDDCCAEGSGSGSGTVFDCTACDAAPDTFRVTFSGVTNDSCTTCADYNTSFDMDHNSGCLWSSPEADPGNICTVAEVGKYLEYVSVGNYWALTVELAGEVIVEYRLAAEDFNCLGSNVFALYANSAHCATWPATVTVEAL